MLAYVNYGSTKILVNVIGKSISVNTCRFEGSWRVQIIRSKVSGYNKGMIVNAGGFNTLHTPIPLRGKLN